MGENAREIIYWTRLRREFRVQLEHGGYCTPPGPAVCAIERARARLRLADLEADDRAEVVWEFDPDPDLSWMDDGQRAELDAGHWTVESCFVRVDDEHASLGGIVGPPDDPYRRTVEAELAAEVFAALEAERARAQWAARQGIPTVTAHYSDAHEAFLGSCFSSVPGDPNA